MSQSILTGEQNFLLHESKCFNGWANFFIAYVGQSILMAQQNILWIMLASSIRFESNSVWISSTFPKFVLDK